MQEMSYIVAIDIGNTSVSLGTYHRGRWRVIKVPSNKDYGVRYYYGMIKKLRLKRDIKGFIISSVVPELTVKLKSAAEKFSERVILMNWKLNTGLRFDIPEPQKTGTDRIAGAVAAYHEFRSPLMVADFGTATTLTVVGKEGRYLGGAILPGMEMMNYALSERTSLLKRIRIKRPSSSIGNNTSKAILSGIIYGTAGAVARLKKEFEKELGYELLLILTGGNAETMKEYIENIHAIRPYLVLEGLRLVFERNTL